MCQIVSGTPYRVRNAVTMCPMQVVSSMEPCRQHGQCEGDCRQCISSQGRKASCSAAIPDANSPWYSFPWRPVVIACSHSQNKPLNLVGLSSLFSLLSDPKRPRGACLQKKRKSRHRELWPRQGRSWHEPVRMPPGSLSLCLQRYPEQLTIPIFWEKGNTANKQIQ